VTLATGLASHLERPLARGHVPLRAHTGAAGGAACGDLIRISLALDPEDPRARICDAGFDAAGCGASIAAGSAVIALLRGTPLLDAALIGAETIAAELGGLSPAKRHAAELAADALHRALGSALRGQALLPPVDRRTLVAMSGGVDSAVAALLVSRAGDHAVAVTLELWSDPQHDGTLSCCSAQAVRTARALAHDLRLPHFSIDLRAEFRDGVVDPWLAGHAAGVTPNPCVRCNGSVRIDAMLQLADRLGAAALATGHYARIHRGVPHRGGGRGYADGLLRGEPARELELDGEQREAEPRCRPLLRMAADPAKDQSYALSALCPDSLARLRLPLGELTKPEVRAIAERAGLPVARRRDSQDLCFLSGTTRDEFLARHARLHRRAGPIVDRDGRVLGEHGGVHTLTVGQRRGLQIAAAPAGLHPHRHGEPLFVLATDSATNTVTVGPRAALLSDTVSVREATLHRDGALVDALKVRYRGARLRCRLAAPHAAGTHETIELQLLQPAERTAPGQVACLYAGDLIVGHGTIC
jgi:tRNA-uridine 2-sulfurtransferase